MKTRPSRAEYMKRWRKENREQYLKYHRSNVKAWRDANPLKYREQHIRRKYGITLAEHDALLAKQSGVCAGCGVDKPGGKKTAWWNVDHCHTTGVVRGLLCWKCNIVLGAVCDNPETLRNLARYLEGS